MIYCHVTHQLEQLQQNQQQSQRQQNYRKKMHHHQYQRQLASPDNEMKGASKRQRTRLDKRDATTIGDHHQQQCYASLSSCIMYSGRQRHLQMLRLKKSFSQSSSFSLLHNQPHSWWWMQTLLLLLLWLQILVTSSSSATACCFQIAPTRSSRSASQTRFENHQVAGQSFGSSLFMTSSSSVPKRNGKEQNNSKHSIPLPPVNDKTVMKKSINNLPRHVAFVCDGNSRWAKARNLPSVMGHVAGADRLVQVLKALLQNKDNGVSYCTMYGFSTENWSRPAQEVADIFAVMEATVQNFYSQIMQQENLRFRILGDLDDDRIPTSLREILQKLERETAHRHANNDDDDDDHINSKGQTLCVAINYGGRHDILQASKRIALQALAAAAKADRATAEAARTNGSTSNDFDLDRFMTEDAFASLLCTAGIPDPDLIIRTSGEYRLSNFLLWNAAYSELYFSDVFWPDFDEVCLNQALSWYATRKRRFGSRQEKEVGGGGGGPSPTMQQISSSS